MAIKIKGSTIIDDNKNIQDNTGFFSDANNSALRPRSSSGTSFIQRWDGSSWENLASFNDSGISFYRSVNINESFSSPNFLVTSDDVYIRSNSSTGNIVLDSGTSGTINRIASFSAGSNNIIFNRSTNVLNTFTSLNYYYDGNAAIRCPAGNFLTGQVGNGGITNSSVWNYTWIGKLEDWQGYNRYMLQTQFIKCEGGLYINPNAPMPFGGTIATMYIHSTGGVSWSFSSRRNKTFIQDLNIDYKKIFNLRPVTYKDLWVQHPDFDENTNRIELDGIRVGLIAEEVYEEIPEICEYGYHFLDQIETYDIDEYGNKINTSRKPKTGAVKQAVNVNYDRLPVLLIGALKEMNKEIESLKKENKDLRIEIENIRSILNNNNLS